MPAKTRARPRKNSAKAEAPRRGPQTGVDQYIASQLKAIYDEVVNEPVPDRLLQLLDQLDGDGKS
jgi:hypothetical protein